ncbi:MAG: GntR family transcriptional regulator [Hyphomonadaceae bacterium]
MPSSATEKTYEAIKLALLNGRLAFGPLDIRRLGDRLRVSATPVREALARLACERLVLFVPQQGYSFAPPSAALLTDLYALNADLVGLALAGRTVPPGRPGVAGPFPGSAPATLLSATFLAIASSQPNRELEDQIKRTNDRLYLARTFEPLVFRGTLRDARRLAALWDARQIDSMRLALARYRRARTRKAVEIARLIAGSPRPGEHAETRRT